MTVTAGFRGTSRESVAALLEQGVTARAPGDELFGVAQVLDSQPALRRALTDPSRGADDRATLARNVFGGKVGAPALDLVTEATSKPWSRVRDLADALEYLGVFAEVLEAEASGSLDELEDELFRFGRIVESNPELRAALGDSTAPAQRRMELARRLVEGKVGPAAQRLIEQAVAAPRGQSLLEALEAYAEIAAARRERLVAVVRTAVALTEQQQQRLERILAERFGRDVHLNVAVEPDVVGGIRIEVGDEVIDGSIAARLDDARRKLTGGA